MKKRLLAISSISLIVFLSGCIQPQYEKKPKKDEEREEAEVGELSEGQIKAMEDMEENSVDNALDNIRSVYIHPDIKEEDLPLDINSVSDEKNVDAVAQFVSNQFYRYMIGDIDGHTFIKKTKKYLAEEFTSQLGNSDKERGETMTMVYENYYKTSETKNTRYVFLSKALPDKVIDGVKVVYRRYNLANDTDIFFEMRFKEEKGTWLLIDDIPTVSPYTNKEYVDGTGKKLSDDVEVGEIGEEDQGKEKEKGANE